MRNVVSAVFDLPRHVWISPDLLGTAVDAGYGGLRFEVRTPIQVPDQAVDIVTPPPLPGVRTDAEEFGAKPWVMNYAAFMDRPAIALCRIGLVAPLAGNETLPLRHWQREEDLTERVRDALEDRVAGWFELFRSWVEVVTGQDLDYRHPVYDVVFPGQGLHVWDGEEFQPPGGMQLTTPHVTPLPSSEWAALLTLVRDGKEPPVEYLLSRDARAALVRGDTRRAVLDAATAVEVVLTDLFDKELSALSAPLKSALRKENRTLGRLVGLLAKASVEVGATQEELTKLTTARNQAAHRGVGPSSFDTVLVVDISARIVEARGALAPGTKIT